MEGSDESDDDEKNDENVPKASGEPKMTEEERIEFEKIKLEEERKKIEYEKGLRTGKIIPTATRNPIEDPNTDSESQSDSEDDTKVKGNDDRLPNSTKASKLN